MLRVLVSLSLFLTLGAYADVKKEIESLIKKEIEYSNNENIEKVISLIHKKSAILMPTIQSLNTMYSLYNIKCDLLNFNIINNDEKYIFAKIKTKCQKITGPSFLAHQGEQLGIYRKEANRWKLFSKVVLESRPIANELSNQKLQKYRNPHQEVCIIVPRGGIRMECGSIFALSALLNRYYKNISYGSSVLNSMSVKTHPGDYPFMRNRAEALGLFINKQYHHKEQIHEWKNFSNSKKKKILRFMMKKISNFTKRHNKIKKIDNMTSRFLNQCLDYWSDDKAMYDKRIAPPKIDEVASLCAAEFGVFPLSKK